jgi:hypothetical protein
MATSFSGRKSRREPPTIGKQLASFITCGCESSAPFFSSPERPSSVGFSPAFSTTKTGCHDIAEILLEVVLNTINQIKSNICQWHLKIKR